MPEERTSGGVTNTEKIGPIAAMEILFNPPAIEAQEARGQRELVASTKLPTDCRDDEPMIALGFTFGPADEGDPMFRDATLPEGWRRRGSDHAMWSHIIDERGIKRVSIFYKAAFYDRSAHMGLLNVGLTVARDAIYSETADIPWAALTPEESGDAVKGLEEMLADITRHPSIYGRHEARTRALLATRPS